MATHRGTDTRHIVGRWAVDWKRAYQGMAAAAPGSSAAGAQSGSANTNRLLAALGRISGVRRMNAEAEFAEPVLTATYWRPSTA